jgi:hypothetical protein
MLHKLLALDERFQGLENWLVHAPMTRPPRPTWASNPYFMAAEERLAARTRTAPGVQMLHDIAADEVDECMLLLSQSFLGYPFGALAPIPDYDQHYLSADPRRSYKRHVDNLKLIGFAAQERRWLLKDPSHSIHIEALIDCLDGVKILNCVRDPVDVLPSICNLAVATVQGITPTPIGRKWRSYIGERESRMWRAATERILSVRRRHPAQVHDVRFTPLVTDPLSAVRDIYAVLGEELSADVEQRMTRWIAERTDRRRTQNPARLADCGIQEELVRDQFDEYRRVYGFA